MLTRVEIDNFRGFRRFDAAVEPVTAFLGPNSSGKTTVLHAVRLACDLLRVALESEYRPKVEREQGVDWIVVTSETLLGDHTRLLPLADWRAFFVDQVAGVGASFGVTLTFSETDTIQTLRVLVTCGNNEQLKVDVRVRSAEAMATVGAISPKSPLRHQTLTAMLTADAPLAVFVPPFYGTVPAEEYRARVVIDRLLGSGDQSHVVRNLVAALEPEQFTRLNAFLQTAIGATLVYRTTGDALQTESPMRVRFKDTNGEIELSAAGAGLVNLIALYAALSRWRLEARERPVLFLLDEPEAHLHPRLQAESTAFLARTVTQEFGAQLLLATHSVDILNRLATDGHLLLRCDRSAQPSVVALDGDSALFDDLARWVDLAPYTAINFLAARRVLFCEGPDDHKLLGRLASLRFRNLPARLQQFRRWAIIPLHGASNAPLSELLGRLVKNDVVRAQAKGAGFQAMVVLDRDEHRQPGTYTKDEDGVTETTVVWSRHSLESLLLDARALAAWIGAFAGDQTPPDLPERIAAALEAADADETLNRAAETAVAASLFAGELHDAKGKKLGGAQKFVHALAEARKRVAAEPHVWQRGKDRATFVLGQLRPHIPLPLRNQFPTDILRLYEKANPDLIGDLGAAVPAEIAAVLDRMAPA